MARLEDGGPDREAAAPLLGGGAGGGLPPVAISAVPKPVVAQLKALSLVLVTLQTTSMVILTRFSRVGERKQYIVCTMIIMSELVKLVFSLALLGLENHSLARAVSLIRTELLYHRGDCLKLLVPAGLYFVQNNVLIFALSNLDAAVYQVCYQSKLLVTALLSVVMLQRSLSPTHWGALALLFCGVVVVNMSNAQEATKAPGQRPALGLAAVATASFTSGMAGVYFEKLVKGSTDARPVSVWLRNFFLAFFSLLFGLVTTLTKSRAEIGGKGFFYGYDGVVCAVIAVNAVGGMVVAMVIKYADNILKGFATAISTVLSTLCAVVLFGFEPTGSFVAGAALVVAATVIYGSPELLPRLMANCSGSL